MRISGSSLASSESHANTFNITDRFGGTEQLPYIYLTTVVEEEAECQLWHWKAIEAGSADMPGKCIDY